MDQFRVVAPLATDQPPFNLFEREMDRDVLPYAKRADPSDARHHRGWDQHISWYDAALLLRGEKWDHVYEDSDGEVFPSDGAALKGQRLAAELSDDTPEFHGCTLWVWMRKATG